MNVIIELVKKTNEFPYYAVSTEPYVNGSVRTFAFQYNKPLDSIWSQSKALSEARDYALLLKVGVTETRELIETL